MTLNRKFFYHMATRSSSSPDDMPPLANYPDMDDVPQPFIYSFRCSQGMHDCLVRIMKERRLNRTSVIRLSLYMLDCFSRSDEACKLPLEEFLHRIESMEPDVEKDFQGFIRGYEVQEEQAASLATACTCAG